MDLEDLFSKSSKARAVVFCPEYACEDNANINHITQELIKYLNTCKKCIGRLILLPSKVKPRSKLLFDEIHEILDNKKGIPFIFVGMDIDGLLKSNDNENAYMGGEHMKKRILYAVATSSSKFLGKPPYNALVFDKLTFPPKTISNGVHIEFQKFLSMPIEKMCNYGLTIYAAWKATIKECSKKEKEWKNLEVKANEAIQELEINTVIEPDLKKLLIEKTKEKYDYDNLSEYMFYICSNFKESNFKYSFHSLFGWKAWRSRKARFPKY